MPLGLNPLQNEATDRSGLKYAPFDFLETGRSPAPLSEPGVGTLLISECAAHDDINYMV